MSDLNLVSVLVPVYNQEKYIAATLESVVKQTYENWEILAVDDCSTDGSWEILRRYAAKDRRIKIFRNVTNVGLIPNWKFLIDRAQGEYLAFLEGDDVFLPENLLAKLAVFEKHPELGMVYCNFRTIDESGMVRIKNFYKKLGTPVYKNRKIEPAEYLYSNITPLSTYSQIMIRRNVLAVSGYPRSFAPAEKIFLPSDWDFNFLVATRNKVYFIDRVLMEYRRHAGNNSADMVKVSAQLRMILDSYEKEYAGDEKMQKAIRFMRGKTSCFNAIYYLEQGETKKARAEFLAYLKKYPGNLRRDFPASLLLFLRIILPHRAEDYLRKKYLDY
jgi:glycosyltransferase involved in cell wall biosynthesis